MEGSLLRHSRMEGPLPLSAPGEVDAHGPLLVDAEGVERLRPGNLVQLSVLVQVIAHPVWRKLADHWRLEAKGPNNAKSLF